MKKRNLLLAITLTLSSQLFFACNSARHYEFSNTKTAYHSAETVAKTEKNSQENQELTNAQENLSASTENSIAPLAAKPLVDLNTPAVANKTVENNKVEAEILAKVSVTKAQKKELKAALKTYRQEATTNNKAIDQAAAVDIVEVIFAILIPPVGVLLHEDTVNTKFWISLLLTLLFFLPGVIYALLVVTDSI